MPNGSARVRQRGFKHEGLPEGLPISASNAARASPEAAGKPKKNPNQPVGVFFVSDYA